jgi:hypothetical protein
MLSWLWPAIETIVQKIKLSQDFMKPEFYSTALLNNTQKISEWFMQRRPDNSKDLAVIGHLTSEASIESPSRL